MKYMRADPNPSGAYPPPQSSAFPGCVSIPDELAEELTAHNGFVTPVIEDGAVISLTVNTEAWEAWKAAQPESDTETEEDGDVWADMASAIQEGVNDV